MRETEGTRPQDLTSSRARHSRATAPETLAVLERYRATMRRELERVLTAIDRLPPEDAGERAKRWDLAIKLGRELGSRDHVPAEELGARPAKPASAPRLTAAQRRELG